MLQKRQYSLDISKLQSLKNEPDFLEQLPFLKYKINQQLLEPTFP
jgi:hypothetical protein